MKNSIFLIVFVFLMTSCVKETIEVQDFSSSLSPEFGVPLAKATIYAEEVIETYDEDGVVTTDEQGILTLVYQDTLESISADAYLGLEDQSVGDVYEIGASQISGLATFGSVSFSEDEIYEFDFGEDRLDSVRFESGLLSLEISSDGDIPLSGEMSILDPFTGEPLFTTSFSDDTPPIAAVIDEDFSDRLLRLRSDSEFSNGLRIAFAFELTDNGEEYPDEISMGLSLTNFSIATVGGYIAPRLLNLPEFNAGISMFEDDFEGEFRLEDPRLNLYFANGFGIGVRPVVHQITGENASNELLVVQGAQIERFDAVSPAPSDGAVGASKLSIDNETMTPSVTDFIAFKPNRVSSDISLEINPNDDQSNFISRGASLDVNFEVELPIYGSLADFSLIDTTEVDFGGLVDDANDLSEVDQIEVRLFVKNALPMEAGIQVVFMDSSDNTIDSLFTESTTVIAAAPVDLSAEEGSPDFGKVTGTSDTRIDISIPRERVEELEKVSQATISVYGNTTGNGDHPIRLYPEDFIEINLAASAKFNLELE